MQSLGRHILAEIYGCSFEFLNDVEKVEETMINAALEAGAEIREFVFHKFSRRELAEWWSSRSPIWPYIPGRVGIRCSRCVYLW